MKDCPRLKKSKESNLSCIICNKKGHLAANCFENPANKGKVPEWYKKLKNEQAVKGNLATETEKANLEFTCFCIDAIQYGKTLWD